MATVTVKASGNNLDGAVLEDAASESSLRELINAVNNLNKSFNTGIKNIGSSSTTADTGSKKGGVNLMDFADSAGKGSKALAGMAMAAKVASVALTTITGVLTVAIGIIGDLISGMTTFVRGLLDDSVSVSSFADNLAEAASQIPIFGGLLGGLIGMVGSFAKYLEETRDAITSMGEAGAGFNGDMMQARSAAKQAGVSLSEFAGIVTKSAHDLAVFGSVKKGALALAQASQQVRGPLMDMGMSIQQINEELPGTLSLFAVGAQAQGRSVEDMASSAAGLMKEMDAMARLTGKSRKEQLEALKKQQSSAAYQIKLASMSKEQQEQVNQEMIRMQAQFGDVGAELVKARVLGITPMSEEARVFMATMPGAANGINKFTDKVMASKQGMANFSDELDKATIETVESAMRSGKGVEGALRAAAMGMGGTAATMDKNFSAMYASSAKFMNADGTLNREKFAANLKQMKAEQKQTDANLKTMNDFENTLRQLKEGIFNKFVIPFVTKMTPVFNELVNVFANGALNFSEAADNSGALGSSISIARTIFSTLSTLIRTVVFPAFMAAATVVSKFVLPIMEKLAQWIEKYVAPALNKMILAIQQNIVPVLIRLGDVFTSKVQPVLEWLGEIINDFIVPNFIKLTDWIAIRLLPTIEKVVGMFQSGYEQLLDFFGINSSLGESMGTMGKIINDYVTPAFNAIANFIDENLEPILVGVGTVLTYLALTAVPPLIVALGSLVTGMLAAVLPLWPFIAAVAAIAIVFKKLRDGGWDVKMVLETVRDKFKGLMLSLEEMIDGIRSKLPSFLGGLSEDEIKARKAKRDEDRKILEENEEAREQSRQDNIEKRQQEKKDEELSIKQKKEAREKERAEFDKAERDRKAKEAAKLKEAVKDSRLGLGIKTTAGAAPAGGGASGGGAAAPAGGGAAGQATSAADLKKQGLKIKEGDVQAEGSTLSPKLIELAKRAQAEVPGFNIITGLNDKFHQSGKGAATSKHPAGLAMDFTLTKPPSDEEGKKIIAQLKQMGASVVLDEYNHPSAKATAGHIHAEVPGARTGGVFDGPNTGYPVMLHGKEMVSPINTTSLVGPATGSSQSSSVSEQSAGSGSDMITVLTQLVDIQERSLRTLKTIAENV